MGTLCKNCPVRDIRKKTGEPCTIAFAMRYGNSCVNLDVTEQLLNKELEELSKKKEEDKKKKESKKAETKKPKTTKKKETIKTE